MILRKTAKALVTLGAASALLFSAVVPVHAEEDTATDSLELSPVPDSISVETYDRFPVVDSQAGVGAKLTSEGELITLPGIPEGHDAALVRVTAFDAAENTTVSAAGAPALSVQENTSASTTVLVPVAEGIVALGSNAEIDVRLETLASFSGHDSAPGSTIALSEPVTRADTADGLASDSLTSEITEVGVTGQGGVPSTGIRAVWLTATLNSDSSGSLTIGAQEFPVSAGATTITTVVPVQAGSVPFALDASEAELLVDVRGWIPEAPQNAEAANIPGSFVPAVGPEAQEATIGADSAVEIEVAAYDDAESALVLIFADAGEAPTFLTTDVNAELRGSGIFVDPVTGAPAQVVLLNGGEVAELISRQGDIDASVLPLGSILAEEAPSSSSAPEVTITSHIDGETLDLREDRFFTLTGALETFSASESVEVHADGDFVGTASLDYSSAPVSWSADIVPPASGTYELSVVARERSGGASEQTLVTLTMELPTDDDIVIHPDTVVLDDPETVVSVDDDRVLLSEEPEVEPGEIFVSEASEGAPEGFLRRVESIDQNELGWAVYTGVATLDEAILQADVADSLSLTGMSDALFDFDPEPGEEDTEFFEVDEGVDPVVVPGVNDDADDGLGELNGFGPSGSFGASPIPARFVDESYEESWKISNKWSWKPGSGSETESGYSDTISKLPLGIPVDLSKALEATKEEEKEAVKASAGFFIENKGEFAVELHLILDIGVEYVGWMRVPTPAVREFSVFLDNDITVTTELGVTLEIRSTEEIRKRLMSATFTAHFAVLTVPVVVTSTVGVTFVSEFSGSGQATAEAEFSRSERTGFTYENGSARPVHAVSYDYPEDWADAVTAELNVEATAGIEADLTVLLYGAAGPEFVAGIVPGFTIDAEALSGEEILSIDVEVFIDWRRRVAVEVLVPVIDRTLISQTLVNLVDRTSLFSWGFPESDPGRPGGPEAPPSDGSDEDPDPNEEDPATGGDDPSILLPRTAPARIPADYAEATGIPVERGSQQFHDRRFRYDAEQSVLYGWREATQSKGAIEGISIPSGEVVNTVELSDRSYSGWDIDLARDRFAGIVTDFGIGSHQESFRVEVGQLSNSDGSREHVTISSGGGECIRLFPQGLIIEEGSGLIIAHGYIREAPLSFGRCDFSAGLSHWESSRGAVWFIDAETLEVFGQPSWETLGTGTGDVLVGASRFSPDGRYLHLAEDHGLFDEDMDGELSLVSVDLETGEIYGPSLVPRASSEFFSHTFIDPRDGSRVAAVDGPSLDIYEQEESALLFDSNLWRFNPYNGDKMDEPTLLGSNPDNLDWYRYEKLWMAVTTDADGRYYGVTVDCLEDHCRGDVKLWISQTGEVDDWDEVDIQVINESEEDGFGDWSFANRSLEHFYESDLIAIEPGRLLFLPRWSHEFWVFDLQAGLPETFQGPGDEQDPLSEDDEEQTPYTDSLDGWVEPEQVDPVEEEETSDGDQAPSSDPFGETEPTRWEGESEGEENPESPDG